ncbi:MAG: rpoA [Chlamydiales bacterium]|jgi:DNA-directed RNA polymerase subunit alpha|nr:rpoA [Chlamydiales bacterium]
MSQGKPENEPVVYGRFEMPEKIRIDESTATSTFARFIAEPFARGFGHTIGNTFRRLLLNALEAPAIISVRIEGISHEFMAVEGIIEDMTNIILNFKCALLRDLHFSHEGDLYQPRQITKVLDITVEDLDATGQYIVTLGDIIDESQFEIINSDLHLFTVTRPMTRRIDLKIGIGRGYVPSERIAIENKLFDEIIIDAVFSPVRLVNYSIENTRVGQDTDYDRLILEITTDGRVSPKEALSFVAQIAIRHFEVFHRKLPTYDLAFEEDSIEEITDFDEIMQKAALRINEIELSVRSTNCLVSAGIEFIGELVIKRREDMLKYRNFGKKSLNEIEQKLHEMGLALGMDLSKYGINSDNVGAIIQEYLAERSKSK